MIQTLNVDPNGAGSRRELATPNSELPLCLAVDELTRAKYAARAKITLRQHVLLHSGVCPDHLGPWETHILMRRHSYLAAALDALIGPSAGANSAKDFQLCRNLRGARAAVRQGSLPPADAFPCDDVLEMDVRVVDFDRWAASAKLPVVGPWPTRSEVLGHWDGVLIRFPHDTKKLRALAQVAWHFYPEVSREPTTQPDNAAVSAWAGNECDVSGNLADAMATLLRPDGAPKGRPGRRGLSRDSR